jgi:dGTPase
MLVGDCIETSRGAIASVHIENLQQVLKSSKNLITLSGDAEQGLGELGSFLWDNMYENQAVKAVSAQAAGWLEKVFNKFRNKPDLMPDYYQGLIGEFGLERTVCDYIAGMTDWYCLEMIKE